MVRLIPSNTHRTTRSKGEKQLYEIFYNDRKHDDWVVIHSQDVMHFTDKWMGEIDYIVIIPKKGVVCIEIKACHPPFPKITDQGWIYKEGSKPDPDGPFVQIKNNTQALRKYIKGKIPDIKDVIFARMVLFTDSNFNKDSSEWFKWEYYDNTNLINNPNNTFKYIYDLIHNFRNHCDGRENFFWFSKDKTFTPSNIQIDKIVRCIRPKYESFLTPEQRKLRLTNEVKYFTESQFEFLDLVKNHDKILVNSPAGTGKTVLALEAARRAHDRGEKTIFICFNKLLGDKLQNEIESCRVQIHFKRITQLMLDIASIKKNNIVDTKDFWSNLTGKALNRIEFSKLKDAYDHIIIDEAQDILTLSNILILSEILKGGFDKGKITIFGDFEWQSVHNFEDDENDKLISKNTLIYPNQFKEDYCNQLIILSPRTNCRNTPRISTQAVFLGGIKPDYTKILRYDDGRNPTLNYYTSEVEQTDMLNNIVKNLLKENYRYEDITILSFISEKKSLVAKIISNNKGLPFSFFNRDNSIFCTSIRKFKGLENLVIIITDIINMDEEKSKSLLYVGITRSIDRLFMLASNQNSV